MQLFEEFESEHRMVDRFAGSLVCYAGLAADHRVAPGDAADFVHVLRVWIGGYHHEREEEILFPALIEHAEIPSDRGPIVIINREHRESEAMVNELEAAAEDSTEAAQIARRIALHLWEHLDKEDSVIFPEAKQRLIRGGVSRLEGRAPTAEEEAARVLGEELIVRFPPVEDEEAIRGDGCVACSAFAVTCGGIEKEWWNDWEHEYHRSLDEG